MTPKERMKLALTNKTPDRTPCAPDISNMIPCRLTGKPFWDIYANNGPPLQTVKNGGRNCGLWTAASLGADKKIALRSLDAPPPAMKERKLLRFDNVFTPKKAVNINLFNNLWGTNFRMWFVEDMRFRFKFEINS